MPCWQARLLTAALIGLLSFSALCDPASRNKPQARTALLIGNSLYPQAPLANPAQDVEDLVPILEQLGFQVHLLLNADQRQMEHAIDDFEHQLRQRGGVGLFYFAGHGIQSKGTNYLLPIAEQITQERDLKYDAVNLDKVIDAMEAANNPLNLVILDACRNNPLARESRSAARGLARPSRTPKDLLIAYSTAPGEVALDGEGRNSPYAASLMAALQTPKQHVLLTFQDIALRVQTTTRGQQIPWISSSLTRNFYFNEKDDFNQGDHPQGIDIASQVSSKQPTDAFSKHTPKHSPKQLSKPSPEAIPLLTIEELERPWRLPPEDYPEVIQDTLANGSVGPRLVIVPPGSYQMGSQDQIREEHPRHPVTLTQPLAVGLYEVSVGEYQRYLSAMSSGQSSSQRSGQPSNHKANSLSNRPSGPSADLPITNIRWQQAVDYTQWLSRETGHRYRLPSESEWEYLARAGTDSRYFWGNELAQCTELPISHIDRSRKFKTNKIPFCAQQLKSLGLVRLNCRHCFSWIEQGKAFPVDSYLPNPFGLFNMLGNVAEFTLDCWRPNYYGAATDHTPVQFANCTERVIRGGHWNSSHLEVRVSARQGVDEAYQSDTLGFRVVREID